MELPEAIKVFTKYWPCIHESYQVLGLGGYGKCEECQETFPILALKRRSASVKAFEDAIDCLTALIPKPLKPVTETVEVKCYIQRTCGGDKAFVNKLDAVAAVEYHGGKLIELTGTDTREVKPKVKRREEFNGAYLTANDCMIVGSNDIQKIEMVRLNKRGKWIFEYEE